MENSYHTKPLQTGLALEKALSMTAQFFLRSLSPPRQSSREKPEVGRQNT